MATVYASAPSAAFRRRIPDLTAAPKVERYEGQQPFKYILEPGRHLRPPESRASVPRRSSNGARECALKISSQRNLARTTKFSKHCSIGVGSGSSPMPRVRRDLRSSLSEFSGSSFVGWSKAVLRAQRKMQCCEDGVQSVDDATVLDRGHRGAWAWRAVAP